LHQNCAKEGIATDFYPLWSSKDVTAFLAPYALEVRSLALVARSFVFKMIPDISEQVDPKARIIGYGYGPKYADMVCMLVQPKRG